MEACGRHIVLGGGRSGYTALAWANWGDDDRRYSPETVAYLESVEAELSTEDRERAEALRNADRGAAARPAGSSEIG